MRLSRIVAVACAIVAIGMLPACGDATKDGDKAARSGSNKGALIGVTMPNKLYERWIQDGRNLKTALVKMGYKVDLQYAQDDIPTQVNQIRSQITRGARLLIIAPIDGNALTTQMDEAAKAKIPVISYDRLILKSRHVGYYATFDNFKVGEQQATSLLIGLKLKNADGTDGTATGPLNIEVFAGSPDDNNAPYFFNGAMSVLRPYIENGKLQIRSKRDDFNAVAILKWDANKAMQRMDDLLMKYYSDGARIDGVLVPSDGMALGVLSALEHVGYGTAGRPIPTVTGQDADVAAVKSIIAGKQYSTIFKDTRVLAKTAATMADAVLRGEQPAVNDDKSYDNGARVVPANLLSIVIVDRSNYRRVLIDSGYYTQRQLD